MQQLAIVELVKKAACPHCHNLIDEDVLVSALEGEAVGCPTCGNPVKLPSEIVEKYQKSKYLGTNLDIVG